MTDKFEKIIAIGFLVGVVVCISIISLGSLTNKEGAILSLLLTILSVIASWIFARMYSDSQHAQAITEVKEMHNENLRTYALKAAEKVNNLSQQLNRLSVYIEEELQNTDHDSDTEALSSKEERLESTIHMIAMLKSVNDTSLSDWQGVIGEEIEEQREEQVEREEELRDLVARVERLWTENQNDGISETDVNQKINSLRKEIKVAVGSISGTHITPSRVKSKTRRTIDMNCPNCGEESSYEQRARKNSAKPIVCGGCSVALISRFNPEIDEFYIEQAGPKEELLSCPNDKCKEPFKVMLDTQSHSKTSISCDSCEKIVTIKRDVSGEALTSIAKLASSERVVDEEFINKVDELLPDQPWPKHVHKAISAKTGSSKAATQKAIRELIRRGIYKEQIDGKLYELNEVSQVK